MKKMTSELCPSRNGPKKTRRGLSQKGPAGGGSAFLLGSKSN